MKKIVIFGATGNLGAYCALELLSEGWDVIAVGKRISDNNFFAEHGIPYFSVDICDYGSFNKLPFEGIDAVAHFAGELPSRYEYVPQELVKSIILGTLNVLEYIRECGAKKIIFPQTPYDTIACNQKGVPLNADSPRSFPLTGDHAVYTIAKNAAVDLIEHYHAEYGMSRFILRFYTIYEYNPNPYHYANYKRRMMPYRMLIDRAEKSLPIEIWGDCKKAKEIVYVKDFARLVGLCADSKLAGGIYNVGNGWQVSLEEQILGIIEVFSPKDKPSVVSYHPEKSDPLESAFDISKTKRELGFKPSYTYLEQLEDIKKEMYEERFAKLWGTKDDYKE